MNNLPELLRDMATQIVYADKAKNGPPPVEESIPWQAADEIERLRNLWIKAEAQIPPEGSYDELVELDRLRARCAQLEKTPEIEVDEDGSITILWRVGDETASATFSTEQACVYLTGSGVPAKYIPVADLIPWLGSIRSMDV